MLRVAIGRVTQAEADILNRHPELLGLTPIQLRLWRQLWLERGQSVRRTVLFAAIGGTSGDPKVDRHLFDAHLYRLRRSLEGRGWAVITCPAAPGNARYTLEQVG